MAYCLLRDTLSPFVNESRFVRTLDHLLTECFSKYKLHSESILDVPLIVNETSLLKWVAMTIVQRSPQRWLASIK